VSGRAVAVDADNVNYPNPQNQSSSMADYFLFARHPRTLGAVDTTKVVDHRCQSEHDYQWAPLCFGFRTDD